MIRPLLMALLLGLQILTEDFLRLLMLFFAERGRGHEAKYGPAGHG